MENVGTSVRIGFCCVIAGAGAALTVAACTDGPGVPQISLTSLSQAFCEKTIECGCAPLLLDIGIIPPTSCEGWNLTDLIGETGGYDEYGGGGEYGDYGGNGDETRGGDITRNFDQDCADRLAEALSAASCDRLIPEFDCEDYCKLYYGTRFEGDPCDDERDCAQGLICRFDECRDPCKLQTASEGESCDFAVCDSGLLCVVVESSEGRGPATCVRPDGGDQCGDQTCNTQQWCDNGPMGSMCRPLVGTGGACMGHQQCTTSYCPAGFCEELPGEGEPCSQQGSCRDGGICVQNDPDQPGTCAAVAPLCRTVRDIPFALRGDQYEPYYY